MTIALYYWPTPNGWKTTICLEEMGLDYTVNLINIGAGDHLHPIFLRLRLTIGCQQLWTSMDQMVRQFRFLNQAQYCNTLPVKPAISAARANATASLWING